MDDADEMDNGTLRVLPAPAARVRFGVRVDVDEVDEGVDATLDDEDDETMVEVAGLRDEVVVEDVEEDVEQDDDADSDGKGSNGCESAEYRSMTDNGSLTNSRSRLGA